MFPACALVRIGLTTYTSSRYPPWACPGLVDGLTLSVTSCPVELEYPLWELWETGGARFPRDLWTRSWRPQARQLP